MIKKKSVSKNYTVLSNTIINSDLSIAAKSMLMHLLSKPEDWVVKVWDLRKSLKIGRDKTYATISELKQAGYMEHVIKRSKKGFVKAHDYNVHSEPQQSIIDKYTEKEEPPVAAAENEVSAMSEYAKTTTYLGTVEGREIIIQAGQTGLDLMLELMEAEKLSEETVDNIAEFLAAKGFDPDECSFSEGEYTPSKKEQDTHFEKISLPKMFDMFWQSYPLKISKAKAKAAFIKAGKKHSVVEILDGLNNYLANKPDYQAWMHPTTFLNGERWNDEYTKTQRDGKFIGNSTSGQRPKTMGNIIADRMLEIEKQFLGL